MHWNKSFQAFLKFPEVPNPHNIAVPLIFMLGNPHIYEPETSNSPVAGTACLTGYKMG